MNTLNIILIIFFTAIAIFFIYRGIIAIKQKRITKKDFIIKLLMFIAIFLIIFFLTN
ncbi:hypothetical protein OF820_06370 [Oceanotoga sp. DSM 15011]|jgi:uncharacterized membrane protein YozB (DUF420 family)|uniref:Uncharacterized protein n=1 Tax=Oceanotoga teriensis TaxID=515440 RepID=A0AA45C6X0_9BACT|nr:MULTISPECIES: hypothetical protein [Oceanotoga]MDO7976478.1 hypothetical protein [Oceanotoga teriensis]PWJ93277.1 hypothetical protein C7380_108107 [Oceanotoga teriensis]UYP01309.1 hypothetical protein OF820_06370 [Oceanotoga sp. DSM 15011]